MQLFQGRKQNLYSFLFTLPKVAPLHPVFSLSIFRRKITEIDRAVIPSEVVRLEPYPPQFQIWARSPAPLQTMIEKIRMILQHLHFDLCFGGEGGCRACHMHLCQLRSPRGGRLDGFYFCLSFRRVYFGPEKVKKIRHANTGLASSRFLPRMLFVLE